MKPEITKVMIYYHRCTWEELWREVHYTSGSVRVFGKSCTPKTLHSFIQSHDFRREDTPAYFVKVYEVGHDKLQKPSN